MIGWEQTVWIVQAQLAVLVVTPRVQFARCSQCQEVMQASLNCLNLAAKEGHHRLRRIRVVLVRLNIIEVELDPGETFSNEL